MLTDPSVYGIVGKGAFGEIFMETLLLVLLLFLLFWSAFFSASETALFSLPTVKVKSYQSSRDQKKRLVAKLVLEPRDLLVTVFMLNTLVNILIQNTVSHMFGTTASWALKVALPFVLMLFLGEIIPKYVGLQKNEVIAQSVAASIDLMQRMLKPCRRLIIAITVPVSRALFFYLKRESTISAEELRHAMHTSEAHGVLLPEEAELISGYLHFQEATVKELMRPREDILYYDIQEPLSKLINLFVDQKCSRLPVCEKSIDTLLGVISARQFFLHRQEIHDGEQLKKYLSKPFFIPESTPVRILMRRLGTYHKILAIAVDEYGSISGLITREDILEQISGEIVDLRDGQSLYMQTSEHEMIASGRLELSEFNELFGVHLISSHNALTIGGWLAEQLQEIPASGRQYAFHNLRFQVLAADPNKIRRLYIRKIASE